MPPYPVTPPATRQDLPESGAGSLASAGTRAVALFIDNILVWVVLYAVWLNKYIAVKGNKTTVKDLPTSAAIVLWAVPVAYAAVCIMFRGTTIAGGLLHLRVVRYVDGGAVAPYQALIRALLPALPAIVALALPGALATLVSALQIVVYVSILFDPLFRGFADKAAGTIVLRTR